MACKEVCLTTDAVGIAQAQKKTLPLRIRGSFEK